MRKLQADTTTEPKTKARPRSRKPSTPSRRNRLAAFFAAPCEIHATALATLLDVELAEVVEIADEPGGNRRDARGFLNAADAVFIAGMLTPPSVLAEFGPEHRRTIAVTVYANAEQVAAFHGLHNAIRKHKPLSWRARLSFEDFLSDELDSGNFGGDRISVCESIDEQIEEIERAGNATKRCDDAQGNAHAIGKDDVALFYVRPHGIGRPAMVLHIRCEEHERFMRQILTAVASRDSKALCDTVLCHPAGPDDRSAFVAHLCSAMADGDLREEFLGAVAAHQHLSSSAT
jgi:hypothetical protein